MRTVLTQNTTVETALYSVPQHNSRASVAAPRRRPGHRVQSRQVRVPAKAHAAGGGALDSNEERSGPLLRLWPVVVVAVAHLSTESADGGGGD